MNNKPAKGKYSASRTPLGNILTGRRSGKTNLQVERDMISTTNLLKGTRANKKFRRTGVRNSRIIKNRIRA
jgi:hypothetical protein